MENWPQYIFRGTTFVNILMNITPTSEAPIAEKIAGYFGGGGHPQAAGFRTYDTTYEEVVRDLVKIVPELLSDV